MYKAVISDLDGTLLKSDHTISPYSKDIIKKVVEKGIKFFIATGRHHIDAEFVRKELDLNTPLITSNGGRAHDVDLQELFAHDLDEAITKDILQMEIDETIHVNIYQGDKWYTDKHNKWISDFNNASGFACEIVDFNDLEQYSAIKFFFVCDDHDKLLHLEEKINEKFEEHVTIAMSNPFCLEVMPKGVSKGMALQEVLKRYDIDPKEAMAFGDGFNDLEMLKTVGKGLVMGNASDGLKTALDSHEIIQKNDQDAVARYLEKVFL